MQKVYNVKDLERELKLSYRKVLELVKGGKIKTLDGVDGKILVSEYQLNEYLKGE